MTETVIISLQRWSGGKVPILGIIVVDKCRNLFNGFLFHLQYDWSDDLICRFVVDGKHLVLSCGYINGSMWRLDKSFSVQNPEKDDSTKEEFNHISRSMWRLKENTP